MNARVETLVPVSQQPSPLESALRPVPQTAQSIQVTRLAAFTPTNLTEAIALARLIARSDLAPKEYKGKPENVLIGMQYAAELGISPLTGLQNISIINGRASVWGDLFLALVQSHPAYEWHKEFFEGQGDDYCAVCVMKRKGQDPHVVRFTVRMAKQAKLWGKKGYNGQDTPWITSPDRMLQMRARGFAGRDKFSDALKGLIIAEEAMDTPVDTSDAKRARDAATLDIAPSGIESLSASTEPNRGHGNEGMNRAVAPPVTSSSPEQTKSARPVDDVMCNECRAINGHLPSCSLRNAAKTIDAKSEQERKTSKETASIAVLVEAVERKTKKAKGDKPSQPYLILNVIDGQNNKWPLYVWKTDLHEYLIGSVNQRLIAEATESKPDANNRVYVSLEHLVAIGNTKFVDNKPVPEENKGVMPPTASELFGPQDDRQPGEDDDNF